MIAIRTDANSNIAMGHVMRCLSIADKIKALGKECLFIISEKDSEALIMERGHKLICLDNHYDNKDAEIEKLMEVLEAHKVDKLLLDSYEVTACYMNALREKVWLCYIDDMVSFKYPADAIINYTFNATEKLYEQYNYDDSTKFYLGGQYAPLRAQFENNRIKIKDSVDGIFITSGGTDPYHFILKLIKKMEETGFDYISKKIVVGHFYSDIEELKKLAKDNNSLEIYQNISNMADVITECDIAISAGGTTLYELAACGIPTVAFSMADNQLPGVKAFDELGILKYSGDIRKDCDIVVDEIINQVDALIKSKELRENYHSKAQSFIDGKGSLRIAKIVCEM